MRCIYSILFSVTTLLPALSQSIQFEKGSWDEVLTKAKITHKKIFVDFYTDWCGPCKKMNKISFRDSLAADYFNAHFINYKINAEKSEGIKISSSYKVEAYPTMLYLDPNGIVLLTSMGYKKPSDLIQIGKLAAELETDKKLVTLFNKKSDALTKWDLQYIVLNGNTYHNKEKSTYLSEYFNILSYRERKNSDIIKLFLGDYTNIKDEKIKDHVIYNYFPKRNGLHYSDIDIKLHFKINNYLMEETMSAKRVSNYKEYRQILDRKLDFMLKTNVIQKRDTNKLVLEHNILYYKHHKEFEKYEEPAIALMEKYLLPYMQNIKTTTLQKRNYNKVSMLAICKTLMKYYNNDQTKNQIILKWLDDMILSGDLIEAYIYKARLLKQVGQPLLMHKVIEVALTKKLNPIQKNELIALKN